MAIISCTIPSLSGSWWRDGNGILAFGMICYTTGHQHTKCHAIACRPKLWWYAPVASLDNTICDEWKICKDFECSVAAILNILNDGSHKDHVMYPHICYDLLHTWSPIHKFSCQCSHVDQSYNNFKFLHVVVAILKKINGGYHKNQVICPHILYDVLHSCPSIHNISCKYSHTDQSYNNSEFSVAAILNKNNGGYYRNHVICPQIWYDLWYSWL